MEALTETVANLAVRPRFVISKGGITSQEVAAKGLGARSATVLGQIEAGVPVWRLEDVGRPLFQGDSLCRFPWQRW